MSTAGGHLLLNYGIAVRSRCPSDECGDVCTVQMSSNGVLIGVADGLGHGHEAAVAARTAMTELEAHSGEPLIKLTERCHRALTSTRGAVMLLASLDAHTNVVSWISIGNIEGIVQRADRNASRPREHVIMHPGIVGHRLPRLRIETLEIHVGDILVCATDGIRGEFAARLRCDAPPKALAEEILARYGKSADDALVLVGRWNGGGRGAS